MNKQEVERIDSEAIATLSRITGVKLSAEQEKVLRNHGGMCILACAGSGKALMNGTKVLTNYGYKPIETLKVGDVVYNEHGELQTVLGVYPQGKKRGYKVNFSNGDGVISCSEHLWQFREIREGAILDWQVENTAYIAKLLEKNKVCIPKNPFINMLGIGTNTEQKITVPPYMVGLLAGEYSDNFDYDTGYEEFLDQQQLEVYKQMSGNHSNNNDESDENTDIAPTDAISKLCVRYDEMNKSIIDEALRILNELNILVFVDSSTGCLRLTCKIDTIDNLNQLFSAIKQYNLVDSDGNTNGIIPQEYMIASPYVRMEVLRGLIDKVGFIEDGTYIIPCSNEKLVDSVLFLADTLGIVGATRYKVMGRHEVRIPIYSGMHKLHSIRDIDYEYYSRLADSRYAKDMIEIVGIEDTGEMYDMTCIKVTGDSELFLTERCIPTHNTTIVTNLIAKRIMTNEIADPSTLLCTTYSKSGAEEMETRLNRLLRMLGIYKNVSVKTLHAVYLKVLKEFGYPISVISERDRKKMLREVLKDLEISLSEDDFGVLNELLSYQVNNLLSDAAMTQSYVYTLKQISLDDYTKIRTGYNRKKISAKVIDFDDMQLYMYSLVCNSANQQVIDYCKRNWTDIYVDEAQDMSKIQYAILRKMISNPKKLVVIGDDDQCIYQWRGADPSIILNICADYETMDRMILSTNYRCPANIVDRAAVGVKFNTTRSQKSMEAYKPGGKISVVDCGHTNLYDMSKHTYEYIRGLIEDEKVSPDEIAILSRNNNQLILINNMLFKQGIHCSAGAEMKMTKYFGYYDVRNMLDFSKDTRSSELTSSCIGQLCSYMSKAMAIKIAKIQSECGIKTSVLLYMLLKYGTSLQINTVEEEVKNIKVPSIVQASIKSIMEYMGRDTKADIEELYAIMMEKDATTRAIRVLNTYITRNAWKYKNNIDKGRTISGLVHYIKDIISAVGYEKTRDFLKTSERYDAGSMSVPGAKVCMSTMHSAKGREWDHVILFADDNVSFPSFQGINLQKEQGIAETDIYFGLDEGRRLHYVAMTRARKELTVFTSSMNPGLYLMESFGLFDVGNNGNDQKILEMAKINVVDPDILEEADKVLFSDKSEYLKEIDISEVNGKIGDSSVIGNYGEVGTSSGISLDDMETGPAIW